MTKPWADQPFQLLPIPGHPGAKTSSDPDILYMMADMGNIHNAILRGLNAIYLQCPHIPNNPTDVQDFALYVKAWGDVVHHHHSAEETLLFPGFEKIAKEAGVGEDVMCANVEQHQLFEPGLAELIEIADKVYKGEKEYRWEEWKTTIDDFAEALTRHLHDEIDSLLALEKLNRSKELKDVFVKSVEEGGKSADVNLVLPLILGCIDKTQAGAENFPPVPFFVPWLNYLVFARKHKGSWRFNPCDSWRRPRELQFLDGSK